MAETTRTPFPAPEVYSEVFRPTVDPADGSVTVGGHRLGTVAPVEGTGPTAENWRGPDWTGVYTGPADWGIDPEPLGTFPSAASAVAEIIAQHARYESDGVHRLLYSADHP